MGRTGLVEGRDQVIRVGPALQAGVQVLVGQNFQPVPAGRQL